MRPVKLVALCATLLGVAPAGAQHVQVSVDAAGLLSVAAHDASRQAVLEEWARVANLTIVTAGPLEATRVSLEVKDAPVEQMLAALLGDSWAYLLRPPGTDSTGAPTAGHLLLIPLNTRPGETAPANQGTQPTLIALPIATIDDKGPRETLVSVPRGIGGSGERTEELKSLPIPVADTPRPTREIEVLPPAPNPLRDDDRTELVPEPPQ